MFGDPPQRLLPLRGLWNCVLSVSGGLGSRLQSEEAMLLWRCKSNISLVQVRVGGDWKCRSFVCETIWAL